MPSITETALGRISLLNVLQEVVSYVQSPAKLNVLRVEGSQFTSFDSERTLALTGNLKKPIPEFENCIFGIGDVDRLGDILSLPEYKIDAHFKISYENGKKEPSSIEICNKENDFSNTYRFLSQEVIDKESSHILPKNNFWEVTFLPDEEHRKRFKHLVKGLGNSVKTFSLQTDENLVIASIGNRGSHCGKFTFGEDVIVEGEGIDGKFSWNLDSFQRLLLKDNLVKIEASSKGAMKMTFETDLATYGFTLLAKRG